MTTSDTGMVTYPIPTRNPAEAFVWVWLPGKTEPVVAGKLIDRGSVVTFIYGRSYLQRLEAIPLYLPELPLQRGEISPLSGEVAGCVADSGPDAWGRRVIEYRHTTSGSDLNTLAYLLESGSDRIGALDFQESATRYTARADDTASLTEMVEAAERVENGEPLTPALDRALLHGTSVGGARPKALLADGRRHLIAKFASSSDTYPVVKAEYAAMVLARRAGIDTAPVELLRVLNKDILLVERFDRDYSTSDNPTGSVVRTPIPNQQHHKRSKQTHNPTGSVVRTPTPSRHTPTDNTTPNRRMMVSALTILELHDAYGIAGRYATYTDLAQRIRSSFTAPDATLRELFSRITFNILVGNTDDHARNHSAFWDGTNLTLTPAYDICPQTRTGGEAAQAMAFGADGDRLSRIARCLIHTDHYHLTPNQAREIIDRQIAVIRDNWNEVSETATLTTTEKQRLWGRQFLNPYTLHDYS